MNLDLKPHVDAVAESMKQIIPSSLQRPVTRGELAAAFDLVSNKENWKAPIDAYVWLDDEQVTLVTEAVVFFAGCVPEFENMLRRKEGKVRYRVTAIGYYEAVGA